MKCIYSFPSQLSETSPFPRGICKQCHTDFGVVSSFFITLNEGQARLSDLLRQNENIHIYMPDWMSERRALFTTKYPAFERHWKKKKVEEKSDTIISSKKNIDISKAQIIKSKAKRATEKAHSEEKSPENQLERALEEIFKDDDDDGKNSASLSGSRRRTRKLPKR